MAQRYPDEFRRHLRARAGDQLDRAAARRRARRPCHHGRGLAAAGAGQARARRRACRLRRARRRRRRSRRRSGRLQARFDVAKLHCAAGASGDQCLSEAQVKAVKTLHSPYRFPFPLANGVREYPGWGVSGEATAGVRPDRRLECVVARRSAAGVAAAAAERHRLGLRRRRLAAHLRARSELRRAQLQPEGPCRARDARCRR